MYVLPTVNGNNRYVFLRRPIISIKVKHIKIFNRYTACNQIFPKLVYVLIPILADKQHLITTGGVINNASAALVKLPLSATEMNVVSWELYISLTSAVCIYFE